MNQKIRGELEIAKRWLKEGACRTAESHIDAALAALPDVERGSDALMVLTTAQQLIASGRIDRSRVPAWAIEVDEVLAALSPAEPAAPESKGEPAAYTAAVERKFLTRLAAEPAAPSGEEKIALTIPLRSESELVRTKYGESTPPPEAAALPELALAMKESYELTRSELAARGAELAKVREELEASEGARRIHVDNVRRHERENAALRAKLEEAERAAMKNWTDAVAANLRTTDAEQRIAELEKERDEYRERLVRRVARMRALNRRLAAVQNGSLEELQTAVWCALPELVYLDPEDSLTAEPKGGAK